MSYDPKYREWVENLTRASYQLFQVYRGVPVFRLKVGDNPPQYRFLSPVAQENEYNKLCEKIDQQLDKPPAGLTRAKKKEAEQDAISYFQKWQECQAELEDLKRREAGMLSKVEELRVKVEEINTVRTQQQKELADLRNQLRTYEAMVAELKKKK
jgi:chromosome segregation ATPase